jgi:hypothetical protein
MDNLMNLIVELKNRELKITTNNKGVEQLQQTQRNNLKAELVNALFNDIASKYDYTFRVKDGIMLEIANDSVADNIKNDIGSGAISVTIDIKINDLETNAESEKESYDISVAEKLEKKAKAEKSKADKIARDKAERQAKKGV